MTTPNFRLVERQMRHAQPGAASFECLTTILVMRAKRARRAMLQFAKTDENRFYMQSVARGLYETAFHLAKHEGRKSNLLKGGGR